MADAYAGQELTEREMELLREVAKGKNNRQVGLALFITENTVKTHMRRIFIKMSADSRAGAVAQAIRLGLIE